MPPSPCPGAMTEVWVAVASGLVALGFNEERQVHTPHLHPTPKGQAQQAHGGCGWARSGL